MEAVIDITVRVQFDRSVEAITDPINFRRVHDYTLLFLQPDQNFIPELQSKNLLLRFCRKYAATRVEILAVGLAGDVERTIFGRYEDDAAATGDVRILHVLAIESGTQAHVTWAKRSWIVLVITYTDQGPEHNGREELPVLQFEGM